MGGVILLVDDDAAFRGLAARILTSWGHEVVQAGTVAETLLLAGGRAAGAADTAGPAAPGVAVVDVAVVDVGLPDGDGFTLARRLAEPPFCLRVVLISTDSAAGNAAAAARAGASAFVPKDELLTGDLRRLLDDAATGGPA